MIRTYTELIQRNSFEDRYNYLILRGGVGRATFGFDRHINQKFYRSREWKQIRDEVIVRDSGCDLGVEDYDIFDRLLIHHMNPLTAVDLTQGNEVVLDPEFLISTTHNTHNAIHYGKTNLVRTPRADRCPGDTRLW